ncbi:MAG: LysM peptidoglycan-binding domain-containing protein [Pseudomonadales bacterium]|jgi:membrane-bound lytic murein transglycosylase D|nr:LysM peptidoglycan-binding domain-containing protein [Pseudomonadales bacterium]
MTKKIAALRIRLVGFLLCLLLAPALLAAPEDFPLPDNLRPAVNFWKRVYTEADTQSGFLHDSVNLDVVYDKLPRNTKGIETRRNQIVADLRVLASGKREGLSDEQRRILQLWGSDASNATFQQAIANVRWQLGQSDRFREGMIRSGAYRPHIENTLREMGLPLELAALPHVESSFHPGALSSVAATGMWQFMRETAQRYMRVDAYVDERLDPYKATNGALALLRDNYADLGTWPLALTAYNHGANGMMRAARDTGTKDIGRIVAEYKGPRFGFASRNFYAQFLAVLDVERNAERYFGPLTLDSAPSFNEVVLDGFIEPATLARALEVSIDDLRRDNPALLPTIWSNGKRIPRGYRLKIDRRSFSGSLVSRLNTIPATEFYAAQKADPSYVVRSGDTLSGIASRYSTTVAELATINQLNNRNQLKIGQTIILPSQDGRVPTLVVNTDSNPRQSAPVSGQVTVARGDTLSTIAQRYSISTSALKSANNLTSDLINVGQTLQLPGNATPAASTARYAVRSGDTLSRIASQFRTTPQRILALNKLNSDLIFPGQELMVPDGGAP